MFELLCNKSRPPVEPGDLTDIPSTMCMEWARISPASGHTVVSRDHSRYGDTLFLTHQVSNNNYGYRPFLRENPGDNIKKPWLDLENWAPSSVTYIGEHARDDILSITDLESNFDGLLSYTLLDPDFFWYELRIDGVRTYIASTVAYTNVKYRNHRDNGTLYGATVVDEFEENPLITDIITDRPDSKKLNINGSEYFLTVGKGANRLVIETDWDTVPYKAGGYLYGVPIPENVGSEWDLVRHALTGMTIGLSL